jgi:RHS repeat-associated protein
VNYSYDANGNVTSKTDYRGIVACYGTWNGSLCDGAGYDALNRVTKKSYSDNNPTTPTVTYSYDGSSCLGGTSPCYNIGRRTGMTDGAGSAISTNTYNALGQRVRDVTASNTTDEAYGAGGNLLWRYTGNSTDPNQRAFVPFNGRILAEYYGGSPSGTIFDHPDEIGSATASSDYTGNNLNEKLFYPFGELWTGAAIPNLNMHQTFAQLPDYDPETDQYNTANRHYNPTGRWLSPDPGGVKVVKLDHPQTWNMYAYVRNNPTTLTDPTGLYFFKNTCGPDDKPCNAAFAQMQAYVQAMYAAVQGAYQKAVQSGDKGAAAALKRTLDGLGAEGQLNARGQTVNISLNLTLAAPGQTSFDKTSTSTIDVELNPSLENGTQGAEASAAHEGAHAGEITPGTPTWSQTYGWEKDAYETESYFSQSIGFEDIRSPRGGEDMVGGVLDMSKDFVLWSPGLSNADRSAGIDAAARDAANHACSKGGCIP